MSVEEYRTQLAEIEELLSVTPADQSLLTLKRDLVELINLTKEESKEEATNEKDPSVKVEESSYNNGVLQGESKINDEDPSIFDAVEATFTKDPKSNSSTDTLVTSNSIKSDDQQATTNDTQSQQQQQQDQEPPPKKKNKKSTKTSAKILKEKFEIPQHLLPLSSDTEAERTRKRRTIKALKSKFRSKQKSAETEVKQKSWQDFMSKGKKKKGGVIGGPVVGSSTGRSIFATEDGINAKVGVISGGPERGGIVSEKDSGRKRFRHEF